MYDVLISFVNYSCNQGRRQRGVSGAQPPFKICASPFYVWPRLLHNPILYLKSVTLLVVSCPLLRNLGGGPGYNTALSYLGKSLLRYLIKTKY